MAVARTDDGSSNVTRKRTPRKPSDGAPGAPAGTATVSPTTGTSLRLDDLYRLPMPKLFAQAEGEGIAEHNGISRAQLIVAMGLRQIERRAGVRGSRTLEVLPDGSG